MNKTQKLSGVLPVFQTPYLEDESIDAATLESEINWLYDCGADGIVLAMVSEVLRLDGPERLQLAELASKFGRPRGAVVISVGAESTKSAETYTRHAEASGASAVMAIPPVSVGVGEDELFRYYERIIRVTSLPVVVQDASGYVGRPMPIAMQARLMNEFGADRVLFKPEATPIGPRLSALRDGTGGRAGIFEGTGGIALVDSHRRGVVGTMPGADLIRGIVALWGALQAGDDRRAYQLSLPISSLVAIQNSLDAFLAIEKYLLVKQGIFKNTIVRGPVGYTMDEETRREVDRLFELVTSAVEETP
ncbi:MAG TPA: dihydrodipicolinate synthase family protein [Tepidisphaeraceae bacterium]|jgi:4-hydroxy-tetrahydrodipicolinate synthase|nr:dihydrodipicolinate synthase family protein [Tepidisphaeraceae bacterium]